MNTNVFKTTFTLLLQYRQNKMPQGKKVYCNSDGYLQRGIGELSISKTLSDKLFFSFSLCFLPFLQFIEVFLLIFHFYRNFHEWENSIKNNKQNMSNHISKIFKALRNLQLG